MTYVIQIGLPKLTQPIERWNKNVSLGLTSGVTKMSVFAGQSGTDC
jgi:hypothetical protein